MTFMETLDSFEDDIRDADLIFHKINIFVESSFRDLEINQAESELKVLQESGTNEDLSYLYQEAVKDYAEKAKATIKKAIESLKSFLNKIVSKVKSLFSDKKVNDAIDAVDKASKKNPKLKSKKIEYHDTKAEEQELDAAIDKLHKKVAKSITGSCTSKDLEEINEINQKCQKKRKMVAAVLVAVPIGSAIAIYKRYVKDCMSYNADEIIDVKLNDDDDELTASVITKAQTSICQLMKEKASIKVKSIRDLFKKIRGSVVLEDMKTESTTAESVTENHGKSINEIRSETTMGNLFEEFLSEDDLFEDDLGDDMYSESFSDSDDEYMVEADVAGKAKAAGKKMSDFGKTKAGMITYAATAAFLVALCAYIANRVTKSVKKKKQMKAFQKADALKDEAQKAVNHDRKNRAAYNKAARDMATKGSDTIALGTSKEEVLALPGITEEEGKNIKDQLNNIKQRIMQSKRSYRKERSKLERELNKLEKEQESQKLNKYKRLKADTGDTEHAQWLMKQKKNSKQAIRIKKEIENLDRRELGKLKLCEKELVGLGKKVNITMKDINEFKSKWGNKLDKNIFESYYEAYPGLEEAITEAMDEYEYGIQPYSESENINRIISDIYVMAESGEISDETADLMIESVLDSIISDENCVEESDEDKSEIDAFIDGYFN